MCEQAQGAKTWAGRSNSATGIHHYGKECLDIHLLKAAAHEAVAHPTRGLVPCADDTQAEWVTYPFRAAHPILRWLPSKLAEWIAENLGQELAVPPKHGDKWTVEELNQILFEQPCFLRPKRRASQDVWCYSVGVRVVQRKAQGSLLSIQFGWASISGQEPKGNTLYNMLFYMLINMF